MSEQVLHLLERSAPLDGPGREGVAQVVKAEVLQLGTRYGALEGVPVGVPVTAEDPPVRMGTATSEHGVPFAGHVIFALYEAGVRDIVSINDCWLIASDALPALYEAVEAAAEPWFRSLDAFYAIFADYLDEPSDHGKIARKWREGWQRRLAAIEAGTDTWPRFLVKPETTFDMQ